MSATRAPSAWQIEKAMAIAHEYLSRPPLPDDEIPSDETLLLVALKDAGADLAALMRRLAYAATEARSMAQATKQRMDDLATRRDRFNRVQSNCRNALLAIVQAIPEAFPDGQFRDAAVDVRVAAGRPGIVVTDPNLLRNDLVVITRTPIMAAIKEAIKNGEVIEGVAERNAADYIVIRTS